MDLKTQQMIYALDALTVSVKLQRKLLGQLKALMAPEKVELREDPKPEPVQGFSIFTFEPQADVEPYPPCLFCEDNNRCAECSGQADCEISACSKCNFKDMCDERLGL